MRVFQKITATIPGLTALSGLGVCFRFALISLLKYNEVMRLIAIQIVAYVEYKYPHIIYLYSTYIYIRIVS